MKRHLRVVNTLEERLDKALDEELSGAILQLEQQIKAFRGSRGSDLAEEINRLLSRLDRPSEPAPRLFGIDTDDYGYDPVFAGRLRPLLGRVLSVQGTATGLLVSEQPLYGLAVAGVRPLLPEAWMHAPVVGPLLRRLGAVQHSPENLVRMLGEGRCVLAPLGTDVVRVALRLGVALAPVTLDARVFRIGPPTDYKKHFGKHDDTLLVQHLTDDVRRSFSC